MRSNFHFASQLYKWLLILINIILILTGTYFSQEVMSELNRVNLEDSIKSWTMAYLVLAFLFSFIYWFLSSIVIVSIYLFQKIWVATSSISQD